ncbi:MAG: molecular chaperone DnaJ [Dehalococcoidia bacterium]|jgi:molecular chaperone DnaJ|nr:molecular chaperone DnaJ [Dehalococcoidia bacterium]
MTTSKRDYYEVLGVARNATPEDLKKAFRQQALKYHPDRNKEADAGDRFKEVNEAYQVLSDPQRKTQYDQFGHAGVNGRAGRGFDGFEGFGGFGDIFDSFFGGATRQTSNRGVDLEFQVNISFRDAAFGVARELELNRMERCERCNGRKAEPGTEVVECSTCHGEGRVKRTQRTFFGQFQQVTACPTCQGEGQTVKTACKQCSGQGTERNTRRIEVQIPAGIEHGTRMIIHGEGETGGRGGENGDLYVHVGVERDKTFSRRGNDVLMIAEVNMVMAALGGIISVETLDGTTDFKIKPGTQSGVVSRIRGAGIPYMRGSGRRGDQLVELRVVTPSKLNDRQSELMQELAESFGLENVGQGADGGQGIFDRFKDAFRGEDENS